VELYGSFQYSGGPCCNHCCGDRGSCGSQFQLGCEFERGTDYFCSTVGSWDFCAHCGDDLSYDNLSQADVPCCDTCMLEVDRTSPCCSGWSPGDSASSSDEGCCDSDDCHSVDSTCSSAGSAYSSDEGCYDSDDCHSTYSTCSSVVSNYSSGGCSDSDYY
jgi:hypothetical protein